MAEGSETQPEAETRDNAAPRPGPRAPAAAPSDGALKETERAGREVVIEVRGLKNQFGTQVVHEHLDLDVYRGEVLGIVGGSGTGKSVLLRSIVGLNTPAEGEIKVFGQDLRKLPDEQRRAVETRWGVLFQEGALFSGLTVAQNIQVPMREHLHLPQDLMDQIAAVKLGLVGLPQEAGAKFPSELSGGMKKRAGLARALALDPEIVFLDEPTAGLDPIGASAFDQLIVQLKDTMGLTVFMVTHDLDSLHAICDRIAVLAEKRVLVEGSMKDMLKQDHPWIREYFHGPRARAATDAWDDDAAAKKAKAAV
jgi:phospholipid/cholesterol/gamma-HCH transport system ATP-binding protein